MTTGIPSGLDGAEVGRVGADGAAGPESDGETGPGATTTRLPSALAPTRPRAQPARLR